MRRLIVTADDFGLSGGVNRAVIEAYREGILTGASLMMGGEACAEAVALARANPGLQVGLHLTLLRGRAVIDHPGFPSITDRRGYFNNDPVMTGMRYFFIKPLRRQLRAEIVGQIEAFLATGLPLSHIDGHLNIHMHPTVFDILAEVMPRYGIRTFRLSREELVPELGIDGGRLPGKAADAFIFRRLAARCLPVLDCLGIGYAAGVKGLLNSGAMTEAYLTRAVGLLPAGTTEWYCHPGCTPDPVLEVWMPGYRHGEELEALTGAGLREALRAGGVELVNYRGEVKGA